MIKMTTTNEKIRRIFEEGDLEVPTQAEWDDLEARVTALENA